MKIILTTTRYFWCKLFNCKHHKIMAKFLQHVIIGVQNYGKPTFIQGWEFFARFPRASSSRIFLEAT